jgi:hypothetical protein
MNDDASSDDDIIIVEEEEAKDQDTVEEKEDSATVQEPSAGTVEEKEAPVQEPVQKKEDLNSVHAQEEDYDSQSTGSSDESVQEENSDDESVQEENCDSSHPAYSDTSTVQKEGLVLRVGGKRVQPAGNYYYERSTSKRQKTEYIGQEIFTYEEAVAEMEKFKTFYANNKIQRNNNEVSELFENIYSLVQTMKNYHLSSTIIIFLGIVERVIPVSFRVIDKTMHDNERSWTGSVVSKQDIETCLIIKIGHSVFNETISFIKKLFIKDPFIPPFIEKRLRNSIDSFESIIHTLSKGNIVYEHKPSVQVVDIPEYFKTYKDDCHRLSFKDWCESGFPDDINNNTNSDFLYCRQEARRIMMQLVNRYYASMKQVTNEHDSLGTPLLQKMKRCKEQFFCCLYWNLYINRELSQTAEEIVHTSMLYVSPMSVKELFLPATVPVVKTSSWASTVVNNIASFFGF